MRWKFYQKTDAYKSLRAKGWMRAGGEAIPWQRSAHNKKHT